MRRRDLLAGLSLVPLFPLGAAPAVAQCVLPTFPRINLPRRCESDGGGIALDFLTPGSLDPRASVTRASTGTYIDAAGVMQTAAVNAPRWDYDPSTLQLRGLLVEEARTNLVFPSIPDGSANFAFNSVTVTTNATTAPNGSNTATLMLDTVANIRHDIGWTTGSVTTGTTYVTSVIAKAAPQTAVQIILNSATFGGNAWCNYNLANGTVGTNNGPAIIASGVINLGNGWYRCWAAAPCTVTGVGSIGAGLTNNLTNASRAMAYLGTGTGIYLWGGQLEAGQFLTSYIPTTVSAVTRSSEIMAVSVPTGSYAIEAVGGTVNIAGITYTGTAASVAASLPFAWPAAAVTAGERHLRRLALRQIG